MFNILKKNSPIIPLSSNIKNKSGLGIGVKKFITIIGEEKIVNDEVIQIEQIYKELGEKVKIVSITPTSLALTPDNKMPEWREKLLEEIKSDNSIIINKSKFISCDEITDLNRSVRALSRLTHPNAFILDNNLTSAKDYEKSQYYTLLNNCSQFNQIYPGKASIQEKKEILKFYLEN